MPHPSQTDPSREYNTQNQQSSPQAGIQEGFSSEAGCRLEFVDLGLVGNSGTSTPIPPRSVTPPQQLVTRLSVKSTPSNVRVVYNEKATTDEVHPALCQQVDDYTSEGITFQNFLEIVFPRLLGPGKTDSFLRKARTWLMDEGRGERFGDVMRRYKSKFDKHEPELYDDLAEMCSIPIEGAMNDRSTEYSQRVKLVQTSNTPISGGVGQRKPDFVLTPESTKKAAPGAEVYGVVEDRTRTSESVLDTSGVIPGGRARYGLRERQTPNRNTAFQLSSDENEDNIDEQLEVPEHRAEYLTILAILEIKRYKTKKKIPEPDGNRDRSTAARASGSNLKSSRRKRVTGNLDGEYTPATERIMKRQRAGNGKERLEAGPAAKSQRQASSKAVSIGGTRAGAKLSKTQLSKMSAKNQKTQDRGIPSRRLASHPGPSGASLVSHLDETVPTTGVNSSAVQILNYALELHSSSGTRKFTLTARIQQTEMWLYLHSHSVTIVSDPIDIEREPVWFAAFWGLFVVATLPELGFNEYSGFTNPFNTEDTQTRVIGMPLERIGTDGNTQTGPNQPSLDNLRLGGKIHVDFGVSSPGTTIYDVIQPNIGDDGIRSPLVIKFTWHPIGHRNECDVIKAARAADPIHIPEIFATSTAQDADIVAARLHACCKKKAPQYEPLELRALVMRKFNFAYQLDSDGDFAEVMFQLLCCLHKLNEAGIVHRNITIQSCGYIDQGGKLIAVLCNFDYAICPPYKDTTSHFRVCSSLFIPVDHVKDPSAGYFFHHEMESLLYCCVWYGFGYRAPHSKMPKNGRKDILMEWRMGGKHQLIKEKEYFIKFSGLSDITHFMQDSWLKKLSIKFFNILSNAPMLSLCVDALGKGDLCIEAFCNL